MKTVADASRLESNLKGGKQSSDKGRDALEYGVSITDGEYFVQPWSADATCSVAHLLPLGGVVDMDDYESNYGNGDGQGNVEELSRHTDSREPPPISLTYQPASTGK